MPPVYPELMPVYLFTLHAYGSWMPDRTQGYVHRTKGLQTADQALAQHYRGRQSQPATRFQEQHQQHALAILQSACPHLDATLHGYAGDPSHLHLLVSWDHDRDWPAIR